MGIGVGCSCFCGATIEKYDVAGNRIWTKARRKVALNVGDYSIEFDPEGLLAIGSHTHINNVDGKLNRYDENPAGTSLTRLYESSGEQAVGALFNGGQIFACNYRRICMPSGTTVATLIGPADIVLYDYNSGVAQWKAERTLVDRTGTVLFNGNYFAVQPGPGGDVYGQAILFATGGVARLNAANGLINAYRTNALDFIYTGTGTNYVLPLAGGIQAVNDDLVTIRTGSGAGVRFVLGGGVLYMTFSGGVVAVDAATLARTWINTTITLGGSAGGFGYRVDGQFGDPIGRRNPIAVSPGGGALFTFAHSTTLSGPLRVQRRSVGDGSIEWETEISDDAHFSSGIFSMAVGDNIVAVTGKWTYGGETKALVALDVDSGEILWQKSRGTTHLSDVKMDRVENVYVCGPLA